MAIKSIGATLKKGSTAVAACLTSLNVEINEDERIDVSTLGSTAYRDYIYGMHSADTISFTAQWGKTEVTAFLTDVRDGSSDTYTITYDDPNTDTTFTGTARAKKLTVNVDGPEGATTWSGELEVTGDWTFTGGS